jgi:3-phenylpropionate/trans-cinnamate dioxygenase ferredoxin reductase component
MSHPIVFIGGGVASVSAIASLRERGHPGPIVLLSEEEHLPYDRPPLSKAVLLGDAPAGVPLRPGQFYDQMDVDLRLSTAAVSIDPGRRSIEDTRGRRFRADAIVLATGGAAKRLRLPGAELEGVCVLRTLDDSLDLAARLEPGVRLVVVGGGFIGTEVAAAAVSRGADVVLLEAMDQPLQNVLPELASHVIDEHRARGVQIRTGVGVSGFTGSDRVTGVCLTGGEVVPADVVVVGVGMRPRVDLAAGAGLALGDGVCVDEQARTSLPGVFAIGDVAITTDGRGGGRRIEHWQSAVHAGEMLAGTLTGQSPAALHVPWFWSDQFDLNIQMAGWPDPQDQRIVRGDPANGKATILFLRGGRLTGLVALNNGRDVRPVTDLIAAGVPLTRDDLEAAEVDLRKLARDMLRTKAAAPRRSA